MNVHVLSVTNAASKPHRRPGVWFYEGPFYDMGFIPGALVQALPETDGIAFVLCNENIASYSALDAATKEKGGKLIQMRYEDVKGRHFPLLAVYGQIFADAGLSIGDRLIVVYEKGLVRIRKLSEEYKIVRVSSIKDNRTGAPITKIRLTGEWLTQFGFVPDALLTAAFEEGAAAFELKDEGIDKYSALVRYARENKLKLLQVKTAPGRNGLFPYIMLTGSCLDKAGFSPGDELLATCEKGLIKLQKPGDAGLGF